MITVNTHKKTKKELTLLIPGHLYKDSKGVEIIFVGFGSFYRDQGTIYEWGPEFDSYLYLKKENFDKRVSTGVLNINNWKYNEDNLIKTDFFSTICLSENPRHLVEDLGEVLPNDFAVDLTIMDYTLYKSHGLIQNWTIKTKNVP